MIKKNKLIFAAILIYILSSCKPTPEVRFLEPQPINKRDLKAFPIIYQGKYLSKSDSSILTIDSKMIFQEWIGFSRVTEIEMMEEFDTIFKYDTEISLGPNWTMTVDLDGDSATIKSYRIDTIFQISDNTNLRFFKGYLFLNYKQIDSTWRIKTLKLENGLLDFEKLIDHTQIDSLKKITNIVAEIDTVSNRVLHYDLNPKRKELKEILNRKQPESGFIKIN